MNYLVYSILDTKAEQYHNPFYAPTRGVAIRQFSEAVNDEKTELYKYPKDFILYEIGTFDGDHGVITPHDNASHIGSALDFKTQTPQKE